MKKFQKRKDFIRFSDSLIMHVLIIYILPWRKNIEKNKTHNPWFICVDQKNIRQLLSRSNKHGSIRLFYGVWNVRPGYSDGKGKKEWYITWPFSYRRINLNAQRIYKHVRSGWFRFLFVWCNGRFIVDSVQSLQSISLITFFYGRNILNFCYILLLFSCVKWIDEKSIYGWITFLLFRFIVIIRICILFNID